MNKEIEDLINHEKFIAIKPYQKKLKRENIFILAFYRSKNMNSETDFFEDKEIEVDGYIYRFDGRVDYKYVHSCGHRVLVECDNVEITGAIKFNEDEELELDNDDWKMLEETVRDNYEDYVE